MTHPFLRRRPLEDNLPQHYAPGDALVRWHDRKAQVQAIRCNCENIRCKHCGGSGNCATPASGKNKAMYVGDLCDACTKFMPAQYMVMIDGRPTGKQAQYGIPGLDVTDLGEADKQVAKDWLRDDALNVGQCDECSEEGPLQELMVPQHGPEPLQLCKRCFAYASMKDYGDMAMQQGMERHLNRGGARTAQVRQEAAGWRSIVPALGLATSLMTGGPAQAADPQQYTQQQLMDMLPNPVSEQDLADAMKDAPNNSLQRAEDPRFTQQQEKRRIQRERAETLRQMEEGYQQRQQQQVQQTPQPTPPPKTGQMKPGPVPPKPPSAAPKGPPRPYTPEELAQKKRMTQVPPGATAPGRAQVLRDRHGQRISPPEGGELDQYGWYEEKSVAGKTRWIRRVGDYLLEVAQATEGQISLSLLDTSDNKILWRKIERGIGGNAIERAKAALDDMLAMQSTQTIDVPRQQVAKVAHPVWDITADGTLSRKIPEKTAEDGEKDNEMPQAQPMLGVSASLFLGGREIAGSISKVASDGTVSLTTESGEILDGIAPEFLR